MFKDTSKLLGIQDWPGHFGSFTSITFLMIPGSPLSQASVTAILSSWQIKEFCFPKKKQKNHLLTTYKEQKIADRHQGFK